MKHEKITIENYNATKEDDIAAYCADQKVDLVIVGPEVPLSNGLAGKSVNSI
jgi:phosphoribosylamine-glycine ligase